MVFKSGRTSQKVHRMPASQTSNIYMNDEVIPAPTGPADRCARYSRTSAVSRAIMASRQQRLLWCEEQVRIVKEQNEAMFARLAAKYDGFWQTNANRVRTLVVPSTESVSTQTDDAFVGEPVPVE